jgi:hypothetical protein
MIISQYSGTTPVIFFIREAVLQQGYLASQVASFLNSHPSNISRALQKT